MNPIATVNSKQPDKVLFDRAMDAMKHNKFDEARMSLQTLINTYPDSEFIARAKLAVGDSWYAQAGSASWTQAEAEYQDFQTFFPNMPEAAEAQLKIATIHYRQMEKADRDYTQAKRAEDAYRTLIQQYPDSKLLPEAKQHLREVQEVLAEREYRIGRFYRLQEQWAPAVARLQTAVDSYPLYSRADDVLYMMGDTYEKEAEWFHKSKAVQQSQKERLEADLYAKAAEAYSRIITRYPVGDRAEDAKKRLQALNKPVPVPTEAAIAQNKAEVNSRVSAPFMARVIDTFSGHPSLAEKVATKTGEPSLADANPSSAVAVTQHSLNVMTGGSTVGVERVTDSGTTTPNIPSNPAPTNSTPATTPAVTGTPGPLKLEEVQEAGSSTDSSPAATSSGTATTAGSASGTTVPATSGTPNSGSQGTPAGSAGNTPSETVPPPVNQVNQLGDNSTLSPEDNPNAATNTSGTKDSSSKKKKRKFKIF